MFYHLEILKKTGPFYPLWLADTYPKRFLRIPNNKIWTYNISEICDSLKEIIASETMNPRVRLSLRLSAKLQYGVIKLYERQANLLLQSVISLNTSYTRRRWIDDEKQKKKKNKKSTTVVQPQQNAIIPQVEEQLMAEAEVIKLLNSSQVGVQNTEITLRENSLLPIQARMDNFGEEGDPMAIFQQENVLRTEQEHPAETIVVVAQFHHEGEPRPPVEPKEPSMLDVSHLNKTIPPSGIAMEMSIAMDISRMDQTRQSEIIPDIEVIPHTIENQERGEKRPHETINLDETPVWDTNISLPLPKKRKRIIKDVNIVLNHDYMKTRIFNQYVELRCEMPLLDAMNIEAAISEFRFQLPHVAFDRNLIFKLKRMAEPLRMAFARNLRTRSEPNEKHAFKKQTQIEKIRAKDGNETSRNITAGLSNIDEHHLTILPNENNMSIIAPSPTRLSLLNAQDKSLLPEITMPEMEISKDISVINEDKTKKSHGNKTTSILTTTMDDIRQDVSKNVSFNIPEKRKKTASKKSEQQTNREQEQQTVQDVPIPDQNIQMDTLQEIVVENKDKASEENSLQKSFNNETLLGSLDRTQVSLGDCSISTEEQAIHEYLEKEWGNMGVWEKFISAKKAHCKPLNVEVLVNRAQIPDFITKRRVAVNAFKVLLLMKKYQFIKIDKYPNEITIMNLRAGDGLKNINK